MSSEAIPMDALDNTAASVFQGYLVRKSLVRRYARQFPVPTYVVEFLLGRYCASTEDSEIQDERIAWAVVVGNPGGIGRSVAIDGNGDIWVGLFSFHQYFKVSGATGAILGGPFPSGARTYGAAVDRNGILWGATLSGVLIEFDTNTNLLVTTHDHGVLNLGSNYGIALGRDAGGNTIVYLGSISGRTYLRFDSSTNTFTAPAAGTQYSGLGVSTDGSL